MKILVGIIACVMVAALAAPARADVYLASDLVSDQPGVASVRDPSLVNGWGIAVNPGGGAFWVSAEGMGRSVLYTGDVGGSAFVKASLEVNIPGEHPTGQVFNGTSDFVVTNGTVSRAAVFIFVSTSGSVSGWNPNVSQTNAQLAFQAIDGAIYTGVALANNGSGNSLYLADFHNKKIDVLDGNFHPSPLATAFSDPALPADYAPFNVAAIGGQLYVAYARQDPNGEDEVTGPHLGFIDVFDLNGSLQQRLVSQGKLNAPWGMVVAPQGFGEFSGDLLVGNFGDGRINAYDPATGAYLGTLGQTPNHPLEIDGLWGLAFGNGKTAGDATTLYYAAGPDDETHGLFGRITANPVDTNPVRATLTDGNLVITGSRDDDRIEVQPDDTQQNILVVAGDQTIGSFDPAAVGSIRIRGLAGDDRIKISKDIVITTIVDGGAGNDDISGGGGNNILLGGPGDDSLQGSGDRDILIGGAGADRLRGAAGDDLLIAGTTLYDDQIADLQHILLGWTSSDSYDSRVAQLRSGSGGLSKLDPTTVLDDGARDTLAGNQGLDWFFAGENDQVIDRGATEELN